MSNIGKPAVYSILPEDIEIAVRAIQSKVINLRSEADELERKNIEAKIIRDKENQNYILKLDELRKQESDIFSSIKLKNESVLAIDKNIATKTEELRLIVEEIKKANESLVKIKSEENTIKEKRDEENLRFMQKESALHVFATALEEKERKINKYLSIFDNMKGVITRD